MSYVVNCSLMKNKKGQRRVYMFSSDHEGHGGLFLLCLFPASHVSKVEWEMQPFDGVEFQDSPPFYLKYPNYPFLLIFVYFFVFFEQCLSRNWRVKKVPLFSKITIGHLYQTKSEVATIFRRFLTYCAV